MTSSPAPRTGAPSVAQSVPPVAVVDHVERAPRLDEGRVVVVGNFDGVHRGHVRLLSLATELATSIANSAATSTGARAPKVTALTFDPHPSVHFSRPAPALLTRIERRAELLTRHGADSVVVQPFDGAFAALTADAFVREVLVERLCVRGIVVGHDFRFGAGRAGDLEMLAKAGAGAGFAVRELEAMSDSVDVFSSTRARAAIVRGDLDDAAAVLGRPHAIEGVVVHGARRGRTIGFPTANLDAIRELLPRNGVYAIVVDLVRDDRSSRPLARGVANVGIRPTIGGDARTTVEAHLFDLDERDRDLYGAQLRVHFVARLRDEQKFASFEALKAQIAADAIVARAALVAAKPRDGSGWR
ncbi:MAG: bifunctional riboflavin kinase/FAD synthetase [Polyangiales bacterium]